MDDKAPRGRGGAGGGRGGSGGGGGGAGGPRRFGRRPRRPGVELTFDYKDAETLKRFLTPEGKIIPSRRSRLNAPQQRQLTREVRRARQLALLPLGGGLDDF